MKQAITVIEHLNNPSILALYTGKLAFFMARYDNFEKAIPLFQSAMTQWELLGDKEQLGMVMFNYAGLLQETNHPADAYRYAYDSLRLFEALNHPHQ
ncbi:MAG TPA: tetratricopeptide repeat protein, partial [Aggregatilineales bacterium]|nr:tetratricopeptide repeat protein [Aggregatilineales bacterium]